MNDCCSTEVLSAHVDGHLQGTAVGAVEDHLAACPACREVRARLAGVAGLLAPLRAVRAPATLGARLMPRARARAVPPARAPVAAAAGLILGLGLVHGIEAVGRNQAPAARVGTTPGSAPRVAAGVPGHLREAAPVLGGRSLAAPDVLERPPEVLLVQTLLAAETPR